MPRHWVPFYRQILFAVLTTLFPGAYNKLKIKTGKEGCAVKRSLCLLTTFLLLFAVCAGCASSSNAPQSSAPTTQTTQQTAPTESIQPTYPVQIAESTFPEPLLRQQATQADADGDGTLTQEEAQAVTQMELKKLLDDPDGLEGAPRPVYTAGDFTFDLEGIQYFTGLTDLTVNMLGGEIFVQEQPEDILAVVKHFENIYACTALQKLTLSEIDADGLDTSRFPNLTRLSLNCMYNLSALKVGDPITSLWIFGCNKLTQLDLANAASLTELNLVSNAALSTVRFSKANEQIKIIQLNELYSLQEIDLSLLKNLKQLDILGAALTDIDVSQNAALEQFCAEDLALDTLDLRNNPNISYIINGKDSFKNILLADDNRVTMIRWTDAPITQFPITNLNPDTLEGIDIQGTAIRELDVSAYPKLQYLYYDEDVTTIIK